MSYGSGIKITSGFDVGGKTPLDPKSVAQSTEERDALVTNNLAYEGLEVYVRDTKHKYRYNGEEWIDLDAPSGNGLTTEQVSQLQQAYEHSQSAHVTIADIPTKISKLSNDAGFIDKNVDDLNNYMKISDIEETYAKKTEVPKTTRDLTNNSGYITSNEIPDVSIYQPISDESLATTTKTVVGAINELKIGMDSISSESGLTSEQVNQLNTAYEHSQSEHVTKEDLSKYQKITDNTLNTTDKTIPGAINELKSSIDNIDNSGSSGSSVPNILYTFSDAYTSWCKGDKFPIAFFGDSTIDGNTTTGYVANTLGADSTSTKTFCNVLQSLLREECSNTKLRIYNAGFSGKTLSWAITNFDSEFGSSSAYSDVKMIGIGFGINDRLGYNDLNAYKEGVKANIITLINKCYEQGIQPFLLTAQSTLSCDVQSDYVDSFPLRDSYSVEVCNNEIRRELADLYHIPLIDISKYTEIYLANSKVNTNEIITDRLHFSDTGHKYEAGMIFAHLVSRVITIENEDEYTISYSSQQLKDAVPEDKLSYGGLLKTYAQYTKSDTTDTKIMDTYIFIKDKPAKVSAIKKGLTNLTYVKLDGVSIDAPLDVNDLGELDLGLHHLEAYTGTSSIVDFCGFSINGNFKAEVAANGLNYTKTMGFMGSDSSVMPTILVPNHDKENKTTALSGLTITKIELPIKTAGKLTISKCSMENYGSSSPILIDPKQYDVLTGNNTIEVNIVLGKNETLCITNAGDTAVPYFAMSGPNSGYPNRYEYTKVYTPPQYVDSSSLSAIVFSCAIYKDNTTNEDIPTKTSDLINDSNYVTSSQMTDAINNAQLGGSTTDVDLSSYQQTTDNNLNTTNKTIVGSINEINNKFNGMTFINSLSQLGLSSGVTTQTIFSALSNNSILRIELSGTSDVTDLPINSSGILIIDKGSNSTGFNIQYKISANTSAVANSLYIGQLQGSDGSGITWTRLCTTNTEDIKGTIIFNMPSQVTGVEHACYASYLVKNGWCMGNFTIGVTAATAFSDYATIGTGFPKAAGSYYVSLFSENGNTATQFTLAVRTDGTIQLLVKGSAVTSQDFYLGNFTFPVNE